jgi:caa(3)-type oxidase subunit IV
MTSADETSREQGEAAGAEPQSGFGMAAYVWAFIALALLTASSFWLSTLSLGALGMPAALAIASVKVAIVGLVFMDLVHEPPSHRLAAIGAVLFVVLLTAFSAADVLTRP